MSTPSILYQLDHVLNLLFVDGKDRRALKDYLAASGVTSLKGALRFGLPRNAPLPYILTERTKACYLQTGMTFFRRAKILTGKKLLWQLLTTETIQRTLDTYYRELKPNTLQTVLAMLGKVHQGCRRAGWVKGPSPVTAELRAHVRGFRESGFQESGLREGGGRNPHTSQEM